MSSFWSLFRSSPPHATASDADFESEDVSDTEAVDLPVGHEPIEMDNDLDDEAVDPHSGRLKEIRPERHFMRKHSCHSILRGLLWVAVMLLACSGWIAYASVRNTHSAATATSAVNCKPTELVGADLGQAPEDSAPVTKGAAANADPKNPVAPPAAAVDPLVSPDVPPPWLPADSPTHPIPNQFASRQIRGDPSASARVKVEMHAFPSMTCDNYYRHTYEFASWPDDIQGRKLSQAEWAENPDIPRAHDLVDERYIRMPFVHHAAQTPYYWRIDTRGAPMTVWGQGTIATENNDAAWMGPAVCRAGGFPNQDWGHFWSGAADANTPRIARGVVLTQLYSAGYYHFFGEAFTRLSNVPHEIVTSRDWKFIIDFPPAQSLHDAIRCFDLQDRLVSTAQKPVLVEQELIVPQPAACDIGHPLILARFQRAIWSCHASKDEGFRKMYGERYDPYRNNWLRPLPKPGTDSDSKTPVPHRYRVPSQKSFIPRVPLRHDPASGSASEPLLDIQSVLFMHRDTRKVGDEDALIKVVRALLPNATLVYHRGEESFAETARLFAAAEMIIGPHGAGFTNQLWSLPGAIAVELMSMGHTERMYHHHAEVYGMRHYFITHPKDQGMQADEFEKAMRRILGQSAAARVQDIEEGIRRRVRLDTTCVTEAEEQLKSEGKI